ncbi:hypothetical protein ACFX1Q_030139 [Malus domestica]
MNYLFWNCHGLGSDPLVRALYGHIKKIRPSMIFLSETKMKNHRIDDVEKRIGYANGFNVDPVGRAGGLSLWWDDLLMVEVLEAFQNFINAKCTVGDGQGVFRFTRFYGTSY